MRITAFWAKGYRSLRDVRIGDLGPYNIFYGKNGAGKSNILAAMETFFKILELRTRPDLPDTLKHPWNLKPPLDPSGIPLDPHDRCNIDSATELILGVALTFDAAEPFLEHKPSGLHSLIVEVGYDWGSGEVVLRETKAILCAPDDAEVDLYSLTLTRSSASFQRAEQQAMLRAQELGNGQGHDQKQLIASMLGLEEDEHSEPPRWLQPLLHEIARTAFRLIGADRAPRAERKGSEGKSLEVLLAGGGLKEGLLRASQDPDPVVRRRYKQFGAIMTGPPLERPPFEITVAPESGQIELVEILSDSLYNAKEVPLDLAGLGIAQIYSIVAQALLRGARGVGIEEPEAHLHAPTTGLQLRKLLERLVAEKYIDQLFIATHSNLFDLDPKAYYDVTLDGERGTVVEKRPLSEIDARHLYEPGPAKHALGEFLRYMDDDAVVFRRPDGTPVGVAEMRDMLQRDDPLAVEFLRDVHGAAVRAVRVKSKKPESS